METIATWFEWLNVVYGINLTVFYDPFDQARFGAGVVTTLKLAAICLTGSVALGLIGAWMIGSPYRLVRWPVHWYVQFFRNTPPLIQLYFFYFAIGGLMPRLATATGDAMPLLSKFQWAALALTLFGGAFNVEIFRAGIDAVPRSTVEAAESLGYGRFRLLCHIVMPLAFRISLPALSNNLVNLIKTTTLAYAIGVQELLYVSSQIWSDELNVREMMTLILVIYIAIVGMVVFVMRRLEQALRIPGYTYET